MPEKAVDFFHKKCIHKIEYGKVIFALSLDIGYKLRYMNLRATGVQLYVRNSELSFIASMNAYNLGDVASVRYIPSMDNKMIQSFWETTYHALPGRADFERREKEEADRKKQAAADIRKAQYEESVKKPIPQKNNILLTWMLGKLQLLRQSVSTAPCSTI